MIQSSRIGFSETVRSFITLAVVLLVLVLAAWLGPRASISMVGILIGMLGLLVLLQKPELGLVGLIVASFSVPFAIGTGTQTPLNITVLLVPALLGVWLLDMVRRRSIRLTPSHTTMPLLAFLVAATVSLIAGNIHSNYLVDIASIRAQLGQWSLFVFSAGAFLLVANLITEMKWLKILTFVFIVLGTIAVLGQLIPGLKAVSSWFIVWSSTHGLFRMWLFALVYGQLLFNKHLKAGWRLLFVATMVAIYRRSWGLEYGWVSGWFPLLIVMIVITWLRSWKWGLLLVTVLVIIALVVPSLFYSKVWLEAKRGGSFWRPVLWRTVIEMALTNPLLGLGPANYYYYFASHYRYVYDLGFAIGKSIVSHNNYVDIFAQTGLIGLGLFAWFMVEVGRLGWRLRNRFQGGFAQGYVHAALGGVAGILAACWLADWFLPFVYNIGIAGFRHSVFSWLFLGGLVSLEAMSRVAASEGV